jgi:hypothetical protein
MDEMQAAMAKLELEKDVSAHEVYKCGPLRCTVAVIWIEVGHTTPHHYMLGILLPTDRYHTMAKNNTRSSCHAIFQAQQLHVRVSMLEGAARELDDLRKKYDEQTKRCVPELRIT